MSKIQMTTPIVEMDGDEMTRILWKMIKDDLLLPYIDLKTDYYDLGLEHEIPFHPESHGLFRSDSSTSL